MSQSRAEVKEENRKRTGEIEEDSISKKKLKEDSGPEAKEENTVENRNGSSYKKQHFNRTKKSKEDRTDSEIGDEIPMNVPFKIVEGVRHLSPYWAVYRTRTKGRWIGKKMVDVFTKEFLSLNEHYIKVACKLGRLYVNGEQCTDVDKILKNGDKIEHIGHRHEHPIRDLSINILDETEDLLVVDKPPSMPVHACGQYAIHTVLGQLRIHYGRSGLRVLHRLDRTTSGVLLFAKNYKTDLEFKETLKKGDWTKEYVCKVEGKFPEGEVICEQPIGTLVVSMGIQCVRPDGKSAKSTFKRLWTNGKESVCSVHIETGRTHQIRVHAQFLGYPIVGDQLYNTTVWGENKGKNGEYCKPFEELCEDVREAHKSSQWHEHVDQKYLARMEEMSRNELKPEVEGLAAELRPAYDPMCLNCNVIKKQVPPGHFQLFLHCLQYKTEKWCYSTELPNWAKELS